MAVNKQIVKHLARLLGRVAYNSSLDESRGPTPPRTAETLAVTFAIDYLSDNAGVFTLILVVFILAAAGVWFLAVALGAAPPPATRQAGQTTALPDTPEAALFTRVCVDCHDAERTLSRRRTRAEWLDTIRQMVEDGAEASDEEFTRVLEFLVGNFGAVAINTAKAEDLVKVLAISREDADRIVAYRTAKGNFASLDAVKKVPEIDIEKLERRKDSLRF